jgi:hypothetical protein
MAGSIWLDVLKAMGLKANSTPFGRIGEQARSGGGSKPTGGAAATGKRGGVCVDIPSGGLWVCVNFPIAHGLYAMQQRAASPLPNPVLGAAAQACEPRTRAASPPGRQPPVRRRGRGASPGAGRGHRPPNPAVQGPSWTPGTTPSPTQLPTGPRGRTVANTAPPGPSDRAAGPPHPSYDAGL